MASRSRLWWMVASTFSLLNVGGAGAAIFVGEGFHALGHVGLALLGGIVAWRVGQRTDRQNLRAGHSSEAQLEQLQQSVDAIAIEVERIGEAQRYHAKLQQERAEPHH